MTRTVDSLRARVRRDVRTHARKNAALRASRYPMIERATRWCFHWASFWRCLTLYGVLALLTALGERANEAACRLWSCPLAMPSLLSQSAHRETLVRDVASYMIGAQVGVLGLLSIAVSLVTLIGQRQNANAEVRAYYHESLAAQVTASSLALLISLCVQMVWPLDLLAHQLGFSRATMSGAIILSGVHVVWLSINLIGLAHFVAVSLTFGQTDARKVFRERYTANQLVRPHLAKVLLKNGFIGAPQLMGLEDDRSVPIYFGQSFASLAPTELRVAFRRASVLHDVWLAPLSWVLRRWRTRAKAALPAESSSLHQDAFLAFAIPIGVVIQPGSALCHMKGSVRFTPLEALIVRHSFRFRRTP